MENEMTKEMFFHLKKIYRIVIFSFCLNVVCMMVLIWNVFIAQPDYTAFFSELRKVNEYTYQMAHPSPDLEDMPAAEREFYESSRRR